MDIKTNQWKLTAIGMALVGVTALVTGLVVASWRGTEAEKRVATMPTPAAPTPVAPAASPRLAADPSTAPALAAGTPRPATASRPASGVPSKAVTDACNQYAARQAGSAPATTTDKAIDIAKDAAVGAVGGAAVGALGGAIAGGGKGAGKGAAIGGVAGLGAGTLYGIYQNRQNDEAYRNAYAGCMRSRGYTS